MLAVLITLTPGCRNQFIDCKKPKSGSQYYPLWMWRHIGPEHWSCSSAPTNRVKSHGSGLKIRNMVTTGCSSRLRMSRLLSSISCRFYGRSSTGPSGCRNGIPLLFITSSPSIMTCLITWMAWCELWPRTRHKGWKTHSLLWSVCSKSFPNTVQKWLQRLVCSVFHCTSWIHSWSRDRLRGGTREWISILKTRLLILPNTRRPFWSMWRTKTARNIDVCRSLHSKTHQTTISALPQ